MDLELVFLVLNYSVAPAWLLLVFAPRWRWTQRIVHSVLIPVVLGIAYTALIFTDREGSPDGSYFTLDGVRAIFTSPQTVIGAWVHYLIFDLFVGAWEARDAARRGIPHLWIVPSLVLTLLFGPLGLLTYLALRAIKLRVATLDEDRALTPRA